MAAVGAIRVEVPAATVSSGHISLALAASAYEVWDNFVPDSLLCLMGFTTR
jgi:hypothetical protein